MKKNRKPARASTLKAINEIKTSKSQNEFLFPLIEKYNEKFQALLIATAEVVEISKTIREFSTKIVAEGREGQWFAVQGKLIVKKGHPMADGLPVLVWEQSENLTL